MRVCLTPSADPSPRWGQLYVVGGMAGCSGWSVAQIFFFSFLRQWDRTRTSSVHHSSPYLMQHQPILLQSLFLFLSLLLGARRPRGAAGGGARRGRERLT